MSRSQPNLDERLNEIIEAAAARGAWLAEVVRVDDRPHRGRVWSLGAHAPPAADAPLELDDLPGDGRAFVPRPPSAQLIVRIGLRVQAILGLERATTLELRGDLRRAVDRLHLRLPRPLELTSPVHAVFDAQGRLLFVRPSDVELPVDLETLFASRRASEHGLPVRRWPLRDRAGGAAWLMELGSARPFRLPPRRVLTPAQHEVASSAASGATVPEIARSLNRTADTIRSHLKEIYRRLDVASRVELARLYMEST